MTVKNDLTPLLWYLKTKARRFWYKQPGLGRIFLKAFTAVFLASLLLVSMTAIATTVALGEDAYGDGSGSDCGCGDPTPCTEAQLWLLDSEPTPAGYQMEKCGGPGDDGQTGSVDIGPGNSVIWLADQPAVFCDVTFPGGSWVAEIRTESDWGTEGDKCEVSVGGWNTDTGWYDIPTIAVTTRTWCAGCNILTIVLQTVSGTIYQDDYLALKITNNDSGYHGICTCGCSSLRSPDTDPGYPVPELATVLLLGLGLFGLAGYLGLKKHRGSATNV